jgi:adhesin/invasin
MKVSAAVLLAGGALGATLLPAPQAMAQVSSAVQSAAQKAKDNANLPEWLRRTDFSVESMDRSKPTWSIETVQPIYQTPNTLRDTVFFQGRLGHRNSDNTINLGVGYRYLLNDKTWLLGVNAFYDMTTRHDHQRSGLGVEAIGQYVTFRTNYYNGTSGEKTVSTSNGLVTTEKALDGYDFEADAPLPYLPWMRLSASAFRWKSATAGVQNVKGDKFALRANLSRHFSLELGVEDDNSRQSNSFVMLTYNAFGAPGNGVPGVLFGGLRASEAFQARDLAQHTLDKVRRQNEIVVERKSAGGAGISIGRRN